MDVIPQLSQCFFQLFLDDKVPSYYQPILQIMEVREIQSQQYKARISDSIFSYGSCIIALGIARRFETDQLNTNNGVIQVTKWTRTVIKKANGGTSIAFNVADYNVVSIDFPVIGNPQSHSGNPEEYRNHMLAYQTQAKLIQQTPTKNEAENWGGGGTTKRARDSSPNDARQPLTKRQPDASKTNIVPISYITPYCNKWRICGIISGKDQQIKEFTNTRGSFKVFGFVITDKAGTSIRISAFGEIAEKFFPIVENGGVYYINGSSRSNSVKSANRQFNNTGHDYEITLDRDSEIIHCQEQFEAPKMKLKPVHLSNIPQFVNECIDVHAIIERVAEVSQVTSKKDQKQLNKRDISLIDKSGTEIRLTLWGNEATNFALSEGTVIGVKGAIVKEFNGGFTLSTVQNTQIIENPESNYTQELYVWYRDQKPHIEIKTISSGPDQSGSFERDFRLIGQIMQLKHDNINETEKGQYFFVKGIVNAVKSDQAIYQACPKPGCKKKVVSDGNRYRCEKCNEEFDGYTNLIMLQIELADFTGTAWVTIFDELATKMLGVSANQLAQLQHEDRDQFDAVFDKIRFRPYQFRVRVRFETYNDQQQIKWSVWDIKPVPCDKYKAIYQTAIQEIEQVTNDYY